VTHGLDDRVKSCIAGAWLHGMGWRYWDWIERREMASLPGFAFMGSSSCSVWGPRGYEVLWFSIVDSPLITFDASGSTRAWLY
jgi:hypothetical protein